MALRRVHAEELELTAAQQDARELDRALGFGEQEPFAPRTAFASDPSQLGWPPTLPIELALHAGSVRETCEAHGIDFERWKVIKENSVFRAELKRVTEQLRKDGASFKARAGLQAIEMLKTSWALVHDPAVPASVRADLINKTVRWAGLDASKDQAGNVKQGTGFAITINLG